MLWRFYKSTFLIVVDMKEMVGFDMGEDSCGLTKVARVLQQIIHHIGVARWRIGERKTRKIVLIIEPEDMVTFEWRTTFYVQYIYNVSCHSFFVFHYPYL